MIEEAKIRDNLQSTTQRVAKTVLAEGEVHLRRQPVGIECFRCVVCQQRRVVFQPFRPQNIRTASLEVAAGVAALHHVPPQAAVGLPQPQLLHLVRKAVVRPQLVGHLYRFACCHKTSKTKSPGAASACKLYRGISLCPL